MPVKKSSIFVTMDYESSPPRLQVQAVRSFLLAVICMHTKTERVPQTRPSPPKARFSVYYEDRLFSFSRRIPCPWRYARQELLNILLQSRYMYLLSPPPDYRSIGSKLSSSSASADCAFVLVSQFICSTKSSIRLDLLSFRTAITILIITPFYNLDLTWRKYIHHGVRPLRK